jgi:hypothetical protein
MKETSMPRKQPSSFHAGIKFEHEFVDFAAFEAPKTEFRAEDVLAAGFYNFETSSQRGLIISDNHFRPSVGRETVPRGEEA